MAAVTVPVFTEPDARVRVLRNVVIFDDGDFDTVSPINATTTTGSSGPDLFGGPLPEQLIDRYVAAAIRRAVSEETEEARTFLSVPALNGVWADGANEDEAVERLADVIRQWALMKIDDRDRDLPILDMIDLNRI